MTPFQEKLVTKKKQKQSCYTQIVQSAKVRIHYGLWVEIKECRDLYLEAIYKKKIKGNMGVSCNNPTIHEKKQNKEVTKEVFLSRHNINININFLKDFKIHSVKSANLVQLKLLNNIYSTFKQYLYKSYLVLLLIS